MSAPYYQDEHVTLYHGDHRDVLPELGLTFDLIVADPPYGETSLDWDRWPDDWPSRVEPYARSMWCFGSMRMFLDRRGDFRGWKLSHDTIWRKRNGSGPATSDRFVRVHELALHWYWGPWGDVYHVAPRTEYMGPDKSWKPASVDGQSARSEHRNTIGPRGGYADDGTRQAVSVIEARSVRHGRNINETEKPVSVLEPLITYGCPPGGTVLDPFAGSCSTAVAARNIGRRAVVIEKRESQCEKAARRLAHTPLDFGGVA